jgi:RNA polymerase sigma-70 factor (ECF subfamily)
MDLHSKRGSATPRDPDDATLLRRCGAGDEAAFRELYDRYEAVLQRFFLHLLRRREEAEAAVVSAFVHLWRDARTFRGEMSARAWLFRIAVGAAFDALRRQLSPTATPLPSDDPGERPDLPPVAADPRDWEDRALQSALARLEPLERVGLALHYVEGCSYAEIGAIFEMSERRASRLIQRARERLKAHVFEL